MNLVTNEMSAITCDSKYLYMVRNEHGKASLLKIGSGMQGSIPGKIYLSKCTGVIFLGNLSVIHVAGKLILRVSNDKFGRLKIYSASNF